MTELSTRVRFDQGIIVPVSEEMAREIEPSQRKYQSDLAAFIEAARKNIK